MSCDCLCSLTLILMGKREPVALLWVSYWCLVTVCILWLSSWWGRESCLHYFECFSDVLWLFVFCGVHLDGEERAGCFTLSVLLVSCDCLCSVAFILMGKRELVALLYFESLSYVLWLFVFCCYHLDGEERADYFTVSVFLMSCDCLCSLTLILMGKREPVALLWVSYWCLVTVCILWLSSWWGRESCLHYFECFSDVLWLFVFCGFHLDEEERAVALLWVSYWSLVTLCFLLLSSWWGRESRLLYFECLTGVLWLFVFCGFHLDWKKRASCFTLRVLQMSCDYLWSVAIILMVKRESRLLCFGCLSDVLWLFVFSDFNLDGEERDGCFTLSTWLVSCDCLYSLAFIHMGKRELVASLWVSFWCLVTVCVIWLFLTMTLVGLRCVIVVFPDHTRSLFIWYLQS